MYLREQAVCEALATMRAIDSATAVSTRALAQWLAPADTERARTHLAKRAAADLKGLATKRAHTTPKGSFYLMWSLR